MQANKLMAFKDVVSDEVDAQVRKGCVYMYTGYANDCLAFRFLRVNGGYNLTYSGFVFGSTIHTKTLLVPAANLAQCITSLTNHLG